MPELITLRNEHARLLTENASLRAQLAAAQAGERERCAKIAESHEMTELCTPAATLDELNTYIEKLVNARDRAYQVNGPMARVMVPPFRLAIIRPLASHDIRAFSPTPNQEKPE